MEWLIRTTRDPTTAQCDLAAQIGANRCGLKRLGALVAGLGLERYRASLADLNDYGEGMAKTALTHIPARMLSLHHRLARRRRAGARTSPSGWP